MKLLTRRGLIRAAGIAAPAMLLRPTMAQFDSCLPGICGAKSTVTDPSFSSVKLLLGFEGADAATGAPGMTDESPSARGNATIVGNAQIDTGNFKYGTSALLLDGAGDYITFPDSNDWNFAGQFTVECFFYLDPAALNNSTYHLVSHRGNSVTLSWSLALSWVTSAPGISFSISTNGTTTAYNASFSVAGLFTTGVWYHLAADRDGSDNLRTYLDGVMKAKVTSATGTPFNIASALGVGNTGTGAVTDFPGWLDEVRVTGGVARYATDGSFTPPTAAFPRS